LESKTTQKGDNNAIGDLVESEGDESSDADVRRMMITMFTRLDEELKEDIQKQLSKSQENID
jgi:catalase